MIEVQSALGIFEGKQGQVFFAYNQTALEQNRFYTGGKLIAWSILHGGPGIKALHSALYLLMCGQEGELDRFDFQDLPDNEVHFKMQQVYNVQIFSLINKNDFLYEILYQYFLFPAMFRSISAQV